MAATAASLVAAFGRHDTAAYFAHFSEDATFVFYSEDRVLQSRAEYERLWSEWETTTGFEVRGCRSEHGRVTLLGDRAALFVHDVTTTVETGSVTETRRERESIVFERAGDRWLAVHEHLSPVPGVAPSGSSDDVGDPAAGPDAGP